LKSLKEKIKLIEFRNGLNQIIVYKELFYYLFLFFHLIIIFRALLVSSMIELLGIVELIYITILVLYVFYLIIKKSLSPRFTLNPFEILIVCIAVLPFWSAIAARIEWGQPIIFGIVAIKQVYLIFGSLLLFNLLKNNKITLLMVERVFVGVAWFNLIYFSLMTAFTDPAVYKTSVLAASQLAKGGTVYYRFSMAFISFGAIYYFIKSLNEKRSLIFIYFLFFLVYIVFIRLDRTSILVTVFSILTYYILYSNPKKHFINIFRFVLPLCLALLLIFIIDPDLIANYTRMFDDVYYTLIGEEKPGSQSVTRIYEFNIAKKYVDKNLWVGNGIISNSWLEYGFNSMFIFFYPSDLGVFGQVFIYGLPGTIIIYSQYLFALYFILRIGYKLKSTFYLSLVFYLFSLFLDSLSNGFLTVYAAQTITVMGLIYYIYLDKHNIKNVES